jgi:hypothetical protein
MHHPLTTQTNIPVAAADSPTSARVANKIILIFPYMSVHGPVTAATVQ